MEWNLKNFYVIENILFQLASVQLHGNPPLSPKLDTGKVGSFLIALILLCWNAWKYRTVLMWSFTILLVHKYQSTKLSKRYMPHMLGSSTL